MLFADRDRGAQCPEELFPHGLPLAHDGLGNSWIVDVTTESHSWGPIFCSSHDAPVIVYQTDNPGVLSFSRCIHSSDPDLKTFAESLDETWQFVDLRKPVIGDGFSWGRYGPKTASNDSEKSASLRI